MKLLKGLTLVIFIQTIRHFDWVTCEPAVSDPTEFKSRKQVEHILNNLDDLTEEQLAVFGTVNRFACNAIKKVHLEKGNPFRYILIDHDCLGPVNLEHLSILINRDKDCAVRAVRRNRQFWCPRIEQVNLGNSTDKEKLLREGGCPGHTAGKSSDDPQTKSSSNKQKDKPHQKDKSKDTPPQKNKTKPQPPHQNWPRGGGEGGSSDNKGSQLSDVAWGLIIGSIILGLLLLVGLVSMIVCLVRRSRRRSKEALKRASSGIILNHPPHPSSPHTTDDFSSPPPSYYTLDIDKTNPSSSQYGSTGDLEDSARIQSFYPVITDTKT